MQKMISPWTVITLSDYNILSNYIVRLHLKEAYKLITYSNSYDLLCWKFECYLNVLKPIDFDFYSHFHGNYLNV